MAAPNITYARLRELLDYDPFTGVFRWRVSRRGHVRVGDIAGARRADGYIRMRVDQQGVWAHRLAWFYVHRKWPANQIDHINGNPSDNHIANLRDVSAAMNLQNVRVARRSNKTSRLLGAHWNKTWKRWTSSIHVDGRLLHIGWFDTEQQAHAAYIAAKRRLHPGCTI